MTQPGIGRYNRVKMQPVVVLAQQMGPHSAPTRCPSCGREIFTKIQTKASMRTHVVAFLLCLFLCWPCVCVPYCIDSCQNIYHYCPKCGAYIGRY